MNKIKYNLKNVHYAKRTLDDKAVIAYEKPVPIKGGVSISLDAEGSIEPFYADGIVFYKSSSNNGYNGDLEVALIPEAFRLDILGEQLDEKKVMVENANAEQGEFALLFEFDGDQKAIRHVLYNCSATRPSMEGKTKEDTIEPNTETLTISATAGEDGNIKAKTGDTTDADTYKSWYESVYVSVKAEETV